MTATIDVNIYCNWCYSTFTLVNSRSLRDARANAAEGGWVSSGGRKGFDFCSLQHRGEYLAKRLAKYPAVGIPNREASMTTHLDYVELNGLERMLDRNDCTLTPFWHSRVVNLIQQIRDLNQLIDEDRALIMKLCQLPMKAKS